MDFLKIKLNTNEPLPVEHFFPHFLTSLLRTHSKPHKCGEEVFNWRRFIFIEVNSYKIRIFEKTIITKSGLRCEPWN